jgi:hypothetical protein
MIPQTSRVGIEGKGRADGFASKRKREGCASRNERGGDKIYVLLLCCIYGYFLSIVWEHWHFGARDKRLFPGVGWVRPLSLLLDEWMGSFFQCIHIAF